MHFPHAPSPPAARAPFVLPGHVNQTDFGRSLYNLETELQTVFSVSVEMGN